MLPAQPHGIGERELEHLDELDVDAQASRTTITNMNNCAYVA